ncbi:MAG: type VI secretion system baseplate subunit TssF [Gammaproteobacteria bacterium]|nr:type VI secretion system baseplate subunit TssF [Gammaproteobacteria bacterium]
MLDDLLPYYNDELAFIKRLVSEYADGNNKIASRLLLGNEGSEDPHVSRLIEAFALLNARIRHKIDDDFSELTDVLLSSLYPHYQAPIPAMSIVQFSAARDLSGPVTLEKGRMLETDPIDGEPCRFRTCYDVTLWPLELGTVEYKPSTVGAPPIPAWTDANAVLAIELKGMSPDASPDKLAPNELTLHLRGEGPIVHGLYQALLNDAVYFAVANSPEDSSPIALGLEAIQPVGFGPDEGLLPYPKQAFMGYRLLTEYFCFPEKFQFVRLGGRHAEQDGERAVVADEPTAFSQALRAKGDNPYLFIYFGQADRSFETGVTPETLVLGATPVVNLFERQAEPIAVENAVTRYAVVPDPRRPKAAEVYAIDKVISSDPSGESVSFAPFYGANHWVDGDEVRTYWTSSRRASVASNPGSDVDISFVDLDFNPLAPPTRTVRVEVSCINRDLPARLPFGGGDPRLRLDTGSPAVGAIACLTAPTRTLRPPLRGAALWRLVSHLNLNHLSLADGEQGADALRELLALYNFKDSAETRSQIESILNVRSKPASARLVFEGRSAIARGVEIEIELNAQRFPHGGAYLFAAVIERFVAHYCTVNSFTRVVTTLRGREGTFAKWPARNGDRVLV